MTGITDLYHQAKTSLLRLEAKVQRGEADSWPRMYVGPRRAGEDPGMAAVGNGPGLGWSVSSSFRVTQQELASSLQKDTW